MKKKILIQIDHDTPASSFDSIVAIDSGVDHLLAYADVTPIQIEPIIHGAIFTRSQNSLKNTAVFFGGSNAEKTEELFAQAKKCFFGPLSISMMSDPNGSNTTAAAAVLSAQKHGSLEGRKVTVLAGTGPVGQRIGQLAACANASVEICSRNLSRAETVCEKIEDLTGNRPKAIEAAVESEAAKAVASTEILFSAGAAGVELLDGPWLEYNNAIKVAIDINAVPPYGLFGVAASDIGKERNGKICYGAIGVGQLKMKIHQKAVSKLFESNDAILDLAEIYEIGRSISDFI